MIYSGIEIGMFFELRLDDNEPCRNYFSLVRPILQMVYVFVQMYFVFLNQKVGLKIFHLLLKNLLYIMVSICVNDNINHQAIISSDEHLQE